MLVQHCTTINSQSFIINSSADVGPTLGQHHLLIKKVVCYTREQYETVYFSDFLPGIYCFVSKYNIL